jgi:hypothetical protein
MSVLLEPMLTVAGGGVALARKENTLLFKLVTVCCVL